MESTKPSFNYFYNQNYAKVCAYLYRHTQNASDAEDIAQDVFEYCYRKYDTYNPEKSSITTWLYLIVNSRLKNHYRDKKEHIDITELENILPSDGNDMDNAVYIQQIRDRFASEIEKLTEKEKKVVIYKYFMEKSHSEIAELLGITEANSRVLLNRTINKLRDALKDYDF